VLNKPNYQDLYLDSLSKEPEINQPVAVIVHDGDGVNYEIAGRLYKQGIFPRLYSDGGNTFLKDWILKPELFRNASSIFIHKDLGEHKGTVSSVDVMQQIRIKPEGDSLRTIVVSGEFTYKAVCNTAIQVLKGDGGYDPTGNSGILPNWVVEFARLGPVSVREANEFRGKSIVTSQLGMENRRQWLEPYRGQERNV
jgi:hypothetical protein